MQLTPGTELGQFNVAIIGGGFGGVMTAVHLSKEAKQPIKIAIIEKSPKLGDGVAFSTASNCHLLNVPAGKMSAYGADPAHFLNWCQKKSLNEGELREVHSGSFLPRKFYAMYLREIITEIREKHPQNILTHVCDECLEILPNESDVLVNLKSGSRIQAKHVVVAISNLMPTNLSELKSLANAQTTQYFGDPWEKGVFDSINKTDRILLVGTSLTMVDVALALKERGHEGNILALSRHGLLPQVHLINQKPFLTIDRDKLLAKTTDLVKYIRFLCKNAEEHGQNWRSVIDSLRPYSQDIWRHLTLNDKSRFLRHVKTYWDTHRHRMAPLIGQEFATMVQAKQIGIMAGRLLRVGKTSGKPMLVTMMERKSSKLVDLERDVIINCAGYKPDIVANAAGFLAMLHQRGLIAPHKLGLGLNINSDGFALNDQSQPLSWLSAIGGLRLGELGETTAVPELRLQASELAARLSETIFR